jgi:hypothetical protein
MKITLVNVSMPNQVRLLGVSEEEILREADEILEEQLTELNRRSMYCHTATQIAKPYRMKAYDLNSFLVDKEIIRKGKHRGEFVLTRKYRNKGYTEIRYVLIHNSLGQRRMKEELVWTDTGKEFVNSVINNEKK